MHNIKRLQLKNYRLYDTLDTEFSAGINLITGQNAQGKTSLIEAIYVLALSKSHKTPLDHVLIREDQPFAKITGEANLDTKRATLEIILSKQGKKAKFNHVEYKRLSDYIGSMKVVMFAPEDLNLVKGSPAERRRFLDLEMGQVNRMYLHHLGQYRKVLKERNEHLKALQKKKSDDHVLLDVLTEQLIHYGTKIVRARRSFIEALQPIISRVYKTLSGENNLSLTYDPSIEADPYKAYQAKKSLDILTGTTNLGPHRDDCGLYFGSQDLKKVASQGQVRTVALTLKLAVIALLEETKNIAPIILLDDVFSELDKTRKENILKNLPKEAQIFITATSLEHINLNILDNYKLFHIKNGKIEGVETHGSTSKL